MNSVRRAASRDDGAARAGLAAVSMVVFVNVASLDSATPEPDEWMAPISVMSMAIGADGTGLIRILIDSTPADVGASTR